MNRGNVARKPETAATDTFQRACARLKPAVLRQVLEDIAEAAAVFHFANVNYGPEATLCSKFTKFSLWDIAIKQAMQVGPSTLSAKLKHPKKLSKIVLPR